MHETKFAPRSHGRALQWIGVVTLLAISTGALVVAKTFGPEFYWLAAACVALLAFFSRGWTAKLDEVAQHAHVLAWFWGGLAGLAFAAVGFFVVMATAAHPLSAEDQAFRFGFGLALVPILLGYLAYWATFWLRRR